MAENDEAREQLKKSFFAGNLPSQTPERKTSVSLNGAYLRWFFGGWAAWHHVYLDRPYQALLWLCSPGLGGVCCIGWLRDLYRIPDYVAACNDTDHAREQLEMDLKYHKVPPWSFLRVISLLSFGSWFAVVGNSLGLASFPSQWFTLTSAISGALGIWLAGCSCTNQTGDSFWKTCGAYLLGECGGYGNLVAVVHFQWNRKWKRESEKPRLSWWKVFLLAWFFWFVCFFCVVEHLQFTVDGKRIHAAKAFMNAYNEFDAESFFKNFGDEPNGFEWSWEKGQWEERFNQRFKQMDITGEKHALKKLGMESFVDTKYTADDVKRAYRSMAKKWHPDHVPPSEKEAAEAKMQEINGAKDTLDGLLLQSSR